MSELKVHKIGVLCFDFKMGKDVGNDFYLKSEADKVIAEKDKEITELKMQVNGFKNRSNLWEYNAQNEHNAAVAVRMENAKLKAKLESVQASAYAESADAGMRERRLKRALWISRAYFCGRSSEYFSGMASRCKIGQEDFYKEVSERAQRYLKASYKCRAKAEKFGGYGDA